MYGIIKRYIGDHGMAGPRLCFLGFSNNQVKLVDSLPEVWCIFKKNYWIVHVDLSASMATTKMAAILIKKLAIRVQDY